MILFVGQETHTIARVAERICPRLVSAVTDSATFLAEGAAEGDSSCA